MDVTQSNQLGAAAFHIVHGSPELGHQRKINPADHGALLAAYIILNTDTVGLFIYDEDDGSHVHHQFISSRVERCLRAHASVLATPFMRAACSDWDLFSASPALPEVLLASTLVHLTTSQRLYRKIRAIRKSNTPVYAMQSHLSNDVIIAKVPDNKNNDDNRAEIAASKGFKGWLSHASDEQIANVIDKCTLQDRPKRLVANFNSPEKITPASLKVLDEYEPFRAEVVEHLSKLYEVRLSVAKQAVATTAAECVIDRALIQHRTPAQTAADLNWLT